MRDDDFVPPTTAATLVELLRRRAIEQPEQRAYTFLSDGEIAEQHVTYADLDRRARAIGAQLQELGVAGQRALLLYPPGLEYIAAFFGCLYAGVTAVPAYPPHPTRLSQNLARLQAVAMDAQPAVALTTSTILGFSAAGFPAGSVFHAVRWVATDTIGVGAEDGWHEPPLTTDTIAFLQYTSGSTARPKGVILSHSNLLHNSSLIYRCFEHSPSSRGLSWLPPYHDMGLIGGIIQPLYGGFPVTLMSPVAFLQRPLRWLEAIERYRVTTTGGPNFAYDLCVRKTTPEQRAALDLSTWWVAFNGAEPIRAETLERFAAAFVDAGFHRAAFYPCYGLAEATLIAAGGKAARPPVSPRFDETALTANQAREVTGDAAGRQLVGCGQALAEQQILIVRPDTSTPCACGEVGEIWVAGPSVAQGYWNQPALTGQTFRATLDSSAGGPFLRTGDLGFMHDGELFITGRSKDLIIVRGRNHYPQDVELTVERSHPALRPGCGAAFTVEIAGEERLVVMQEVERQFRNQATAPILQAIRQAIAVEHELSAYAIVLLKPGSILKTSSGKIQRRACRAAFLAGKLEPIASDLRQAETAAGSATEAEILTGAQIQAAPLVERRPLIERYLRQSIAQRLQIDATQIDPAIPIVALGVDSLVAVELQHDLETQLATALPVTAILQETSISHLAATVAEHIGRPAAATTQLADRPRCDEHALSHGQRALWFLHQFAPDSAAYHIARAFYVPPQLDPTVLQRALTKLVDRHALLRTTFANRNGLPAQYVQSPGKPCFGQEDASLWSAAQLEGRITAAIEQPFELEHGPLLRVTLFQRTRQEAVLLMVVHHIVADYWSVVLLLDELGKLYLAEQTGADAALKPLAWQYGEYVRWQNELLSGPEGARLWSYWQQQLQPRPGHGLPVLQLPTDRPRPAIQTYHGATVPFQIDAALTQQLRALAQGEGATMYMLMLAAFQVLLYRWSGQDDILVGSPTAGRSRPQTSDLVGYFVNPVALRADMSARPAFRTLLAQVRQTVLDALAHQDWPFALLVERLQPQRTSSHPPIFQVMFALEKSQRPGQASAGLAIPGHVDARLSLGSFSFKLFDLKDQAVPFDMVLLLEETGATLSAALHYNTDLFDAATIERMAGQYQTLLAAIVAEPARSIATLPILPDAEQRLLQTWNATAQPYPREQYVHALITAQAARTPDAIAVACANTRLTYAELERQSNQLARYLQTFNVGPDVPVGVCLSRSPRLVVALLAILKAGGCYLPLDPAYPGARLQFMLRDSQAALLLTEQALVAACGLEQSQPTQVICLDTAVAAMAAYATEPPPSQVSTDNLAYVIYTSGSTGVPKGVEITHGGLLNLVYWHCQAFVVTPRDRATLIAGLGFDASVWELWPYLVAGANMYLPDETTRTTPAQLRAWLVEQAITISFLPTPLAEAVLAEEWPTVSALRLMLTGGDLLRQAPSPSLPFSLINNYGPTENTVVATSGLVPPRSELPQTPSIGRPIANTQVYLLDPQLSPVTIGVPGELYIGGASLARGYLKRPALTATQFVPDPFSASPGARLYRTGDLARYRADGAIEFLGRGDHQVKLRGFRIELGEIEAVLLEHPAVLEVVVMAREDVGAKRLVAYVVAKEQKNQETREQNKKPAPSLPPSPAATEAEARRGSGKGAGGEGLTSALRAYLAERLPDYMLPSAFVFLDAFPLTPNGKIDRQALPAPALDAADDLPYVAPRTPMEQQVAGIWSEVLGLERVGIHDDFFVLGGHSLLATQIADRIRTAFQVNPPLHTLFEETTVASLAVVIEQHQRSQQIVTIPKIQARPRGSRSFDQLVTRLDQFSEAKPTGTSHEARGD